MMAAAAMVRSRPSQRNGASRRLPQLAHNTSGRNRPPVAWRHCVASLRKSRARRPRCASSQASTTSAPPPSPTTSPATERSVSSFDCGCQLMLHDARSPVAISTRRALPVRMRESATSRPSITPLQALSRSKTRASRAPSASATTLAVAGSMQSRVMPVKIRVSTSRGPMPASASALVAAATDSWDGSTSGAAIRRSRTPVTRSSHPGSNPKRFNPERSSTSTVVTTPGGISAPSPEMRTPVPFECMAVAIASYMKGVPSSRCIGATRMPYIAVALFAATRPRDAAVLSRAALPSLQECQLWLARRQERASDPGTPDSSRQPSAVLVAPGNLRYADGPEEVPMRTMRAVALLVAMSAAAEGANEARDILDRRKHLEETTRRWEDLSQKMTLRVVYRAGGTREDQIEVYERRADGERKTIAFVVAPPEVKGTGFLAFARAGRAPEQWLYLPDLKRVRQIASTMRNESFVGSDLTYRDMNLLAEMPSWSDADGTASHLIELTPKREDIGYARILLWLGKEDLMPRKLEFYEQQAEPRKRITQHDVRLVGAIPVAYRTDVETPQTGSHTAVEITDLKFNQGLKDDLFTQRQLERGGR